MTNKIISQENTSVEWTDVEWKTFADWAISMLKIGPATVVFTKKDGTERTMQCTLEPNVLPKVELKEDKKTNRKQSDTSIAVYDIEAKGWRSFTIRAVKQFKFEM
tara:strand:- start:691 stop:1005 length:315 start_codon:yes stop_codon:yes gene_type:complete